MTWKLIAIKTHDELLTLTSQIHHKFRAELEDLLLKADRTSKGDVPRAAWMQDVEDRAAFQKDQKSNDKYKAGIDHLTCGPRCSNSSTPRVKDIPVNMAKGATCNVLPM